MVKKSKDGRNSLSENPWKRIEKQEEDMLNIAVLGYGTVGSGVFEVIRMKTTKALIKGRSGDQYQICSRPQRFSGDPVQEVLVHDYEIIANDPK